MKPKGQKIVGADAAEERTYGPTWYDVYIILKDLQLKWPEDNLQVRLTCNTSVNGRAGMSYIVTCRMGTIRGAGRYLDNDPTSCKTAAAAAYYAITRAWYALEKRDEATQQGELEL